MILWIYIILVPIDMGTQFDSVILQGIDYSYEEKYEMAKNSFNQAIVIKPDDPAPYFLIASLYGMYMVDFSTDSMERELFAYSDTAVMIATRKIEAKDSSALLHLWLAGGYGVRAFYQVWNKKIIQGIQDGVKSIKEFYKTIEQDSSIYDAYLGTAGYRYFQYKLLSIIPGLANSNWESELKMAINEGKYFKIPALTTYALLLIEEKRYKEAVKIATQLIEEFPDSRTFRWIRVKSYSGMKDWKQAKLEYEKLLDLTLTGQQNSFYNIGYCRLGLAKTYFNLGEQVKCINQCNEIIKNLPDTPKIKDLKTDAQKLIKKIDK
ncbi:MAG: tetratricopeptide repeat protein [Candidatus Stahlbacteria bacterium]|nr:tetratricopeptide repeat protein [Candidatus Stahlbacteria bacterium]